MARCVWPVHRPRAAGARGGRARARARPRKRQARRGELRPRFESVWRKATAGGDVPGPVRRAMSAAALAGWSCAVAGWVFFILLLWGGLMTGMGILALYLSRIYRDVRGRPNYIVKDTVNID